MMNDIVFQLITIMNMLGFQGKSANFMSVNILILNLDFYGCIAAADDWRLWNKRAENLSFHW
jgi:hypothetical protein